MISYCLTRVLCILFINYPIVYRISKQPRRCSTFKPPNLYEKKPLKKHFSATDLIENEAQVPKSILEMHSLDIS